MSTLIVGFCSFCTSERLFEVPPCSDGHDDCPDLACVECGHAVVASPGLTVTADAGATRAAARSGSRDVRARAAAHAVSSAA